MGWGLSKDIKAEIDRQANRLMQAGADGEISISSALPIQTTSSLSLQA